MKDGFKDTLGKTITGVIAARNDRSPSIQLFFLFSDHTYFEVWGNDFSCAGGVDVGGEERVLDYIAKFGAQVVTSAKLNPKKPGKI